MKIVFFGTPDYVVPIVEKLHRNFQTNNIGSPIVAVVTQAPKPAGREKIITFSAVDTWAHKKNIPIFFSPRDLIKENIKADLGILAAYGELIHKDIINMFPKGIIVIHPSLLPQFRGGSPVQAALVTGTNPTGVTFIRMDEKFDHGMIISSFKEDVEHSDTTASLRSRLFLRSADVLSDMIPAYVKGKINPKTQDDSKSVYARTMTREDGFIQPQILKKVLNGETGKEDWPVLFIKDYTMQPSPENIERFIRSVTPWPGAWTYVKTEPEVRKLRFKILSSHLEDGKLVPDEVQLEGKTKVTFGEFLRGYPKAEFEA